jgi:two-component sensor histidine kinase
MVHLTLEWSSCGLFLGVLAYRLAENRRHRTTPLDAPPNTRLVTHAKTLEALLREVNHRVKNNFTSLIGLLQMKREFAHTPQEAFQLKEIEASLTGLASAHRMLSLSGWHPICLESLCRSLVQNTLSLAGTPCQLSIRANPPGFRVNHAQAQPLTMIINELAANAIRHATLPDTLLAITMTLHESENSIRLCFQDNGPGYPSSVLTCSPGALTMGLQIIHDLTTSTLGGSIELSNESGAMTNAIFPK